MPEQGIGINFRGDFCAARGPLGPGDVRTQSTSARNHFRSPGRLGLVTGVGVTRQGLVRWEGQSSLPPQASRLRGWA